MIEQGGVRRHDFLQVAHPSKSLRCVRSLPEGRVAVFRPVVEMVTDLLAVAFSKEVSAACIMSESIQNIGAGRISADNTCEPLKHA